MSKCYDIDNDNDNDFGVDDMMYGGDEDMDFGRRRRRRRGRRAIKGRRYIIVKGRKRKLYRGKNGSYYYRTRSGKTYIKGRRRSRFGETEPEYTDEQFGEMEFGARSKELQMLQLISDEISPDFKYSSQVSKNGTQKLLTAAALKRKLTQSNMDWKRAIMILQRDDPRFMPKGGVKFKGGFKYLRMVAMRFFGPEFKYSGKVDRYGRPKLLTEAALKRKLSTVFRGTGYDWKQIANETRMDVLEIYKQIKISLQNSGSNKTRATQVANKIMRDNEEGIGINPRTWYYGFRMGIERGEDFEVAAWRSTDETLRTPPLNPELANVALLQRPAVSAAASSEVARVAARAAAAAGTARAAARPGSMMERWNMDAESGYLGQSLLPAADDYRLMEDSSASAYVPPARTSRPASMVWRAEQDNLPKAARQPSLETWLAELDKRGRTPAAAEKQRKLRWENGVLVEEKEPGLFEGLTVVRPESRSLLDFGRKQRRTR
jgi:hypothetical protein